MSITVIDFPFVQGSGSSEVVGQIGPFQVANVLADGTTTAITFPTPFLNQCTGVTPTVLVPSGIDELTVQVIASTISATGFSVYIAGAPLSTLVTLQYVANGT